MQSHWNGLSVFVKSPWVPMDNNIVERDELGPVVGRNNFYGSGAQLAGELATLKLWAINPYTWVYAYLQACAENAHQAPADLSSFLPWTMEEDRLSVMRAGQPAPSALPEVLDSS